MTKDIVHKIKKTPAYVIIEDALTDNLEIISRIVKESNCKIFLSQKAFSIYQMYPLFKKYISGVTASSLNETMLGKEYDMFTVSYSPAYKPKEFKRLADNSDVVIFNSINQYEKYKAATLGKALLGIRVNPDFSTQISPFCDPCSPGSRFGVTVKQFADHYSSLKDKISGIMFHTLSKQRVKDLLETVKVIETQFGKYLYDLDWISFGGGVHFTKKEELYAIDELIRFIIQFQQKYNIQVWLEPGEAVTYDSGVLVSKILDIVENNNTTTAILDCSPYAHMPDILYLSEPPEIVNAFPTDHCKYNYRIAACSCLSGDILGDYSFQKPLHIGDTLIIKNQLSYTMSCNNWFNGITLPDIGIIHSNGTYDIIKSYSFNDYKNTL